MKLLTLFSSVLLCFCLTEINGLKLPGPLVYVVTPSPRPPKNDEGRSAPFYYQNWMRRMDSAPNSTTTTTAKPKVQTPDLIFAEFESGGANNMKSIRKLLERERIQPKTTTTTTTTTSRPIYVPDEDTKEVTRVVNYGLPVPTDKKETKPNSDNNDYFSMYNALYNNEQVPVYLPQTTSTSTTRVPPTTTTTTTTTTAAPVNVENIWHIIDNEKYNQYSGRWEEEPVANENGQNTGSEDKLQKDIGNENSEKDITTEYTPVDENFALPGIGTNPGNGAENESRAIRTEPSMRFPYVNLKPFQMKNQKTPITNSFSNSKKGNNIFTSLDSFHEVKNPVRGEVQDVVAMRQPIDRYNPAQPYLPDYGTYSKQSPGKTTPVKSVANLVPPPPPPPPRVTDNDFPSPVNYDSFPPYAPAPPPSVLSSTQAPLPPPPPPSQAPPVSMYQPPVQDSPYEADSDSPPSDDYASFKQPPSHFLPTLPPLKNPFGGYSYNRPSMTVDSPSTKDVEEKPDFQGYHYSKPEPPAPSNDYPPSGYGHNSPPHHYDSDYPELIFNKHHGGVGDTKDGNDIKDAGMAPPPPPDAKPDHGPPMDSGPPMDDHGFPHDFPGDLKFHYDDDHHYHHHHHETTTTTEQPRVNRYSYYYLGKKLYYLPLYFSVYFIVYVGALIIKAVLRHKIVYPNSWRPNDTTASFFTKRSIESFNMSKEQLHEITGRVTHAIATAAEKYMNGKKEQ